MIRFYFVNNDGDLEEFTDRVNLADTRVKLTTQAEQGTIGTSTLIVDDPDGDWDIHGHRWVIALESTADPQLIYWGYAAERDIKRMAPYVLASREWHMTLTDINTLLGRRIMRGSDCNRPEETDVERIQWLTTTTEQGFIDDPTTFLDTAGPVAMDAVDYRHQYASQIYDDCSQASGKNYFLYPYFDTPNWKCGFWYGFGGSTDYSSAIKISNDLADIDDVITFGPGLETNLNRSPSRVFSGVSVPYDGGITYQRLDSTVTAFANRDTSSPMPNVKSEAKANNRAIRYLHTINTEEDIIDTYIMVPPSQVNDVLAGQRIEAKYTHLPGYEADSWMRVLKRTVTFLTPAEYGIDLTLSAQPAVATPFPIPGDVNDGMTCSINGYIVPTCEGTAPNVDHLTIGPIDGTSTTGGLPLYWSDADGTDGYVQTDPWAVELYSDCTYFIAFTNIVHATTNFECNLNGVMNGLVVNGHFGNLPPMPPSIPPGTALTEYSTSFLWDTGNVSDCTPVAIQEGAGYAGCNCIGSSAEVTITYVSGPDPRFEDLLTCPDPDWSP